MGKILQSEKPQSPNNKTFTSPKSTGTFSNQH
jgi:hypothetical protein